MSEWGRSASAQCDFSDRRRPAGCAVTACRQPRSDASDMASSSMTAAVGPRLCKNCAVGYEFLVLPLSHGGRMDVRVLGALAPTKVPHSLGNVGMGPLRLGTVRFLGPETTGRLRRHRVPATPIGRIRHGFVVYDGGCRAQAV